MTKNKRVAPVRRSDDGIPREGDLLVVSLPGAACATCALRAERGLIALPGVRSAIVDVAIETASIGYDSSRISSGPIVSQLAGNGFDPRRCRVSLPIAADGFGHTELIRTEEAIARLPGVTSCRIDPVEQVAIIDYLPGSIEVDSIRSELSTLGSEAEHPAPWGDKSHQSRSRRHAWMDFSVAFVGSLAGWLLYVRGGGGGDLLDPVRLWLGQAVPDLPRSSQVIAMLLVAVLTIAAAGRRLLVHSFRSIRSRLLPAEALSLMAILFSLAAGGALVLSGRFPGELLISPEILLAIHLFGRAVSLSTFRRATRSAGRAPSAAGSPDGPLAGPLAVRLLWNRGDRATMETRGERLAVLWPPLVLSAAIAVFAAWIYTTGDVVIAILAGLAVTVAFPVGLINLSGVLPVRVVRDTALGEGIAFRSGRTVERAARVTAMVVLDSAICREAAVTDFVLLDGLTQHELLRLSSAAMFHSQSPLARAVVSRALRAGIVPPTLVPSESSHRGVAGEMEGVGVIAGQPGWLEEKGVSLEGVTEDLDRFSASGKSVIAVAKGGKTAGLVIVEKPMMESAAEALRRLGEIGVETILATSDAKSSARARGALLGAGAVEGELSEGDVLRLISRLQREGKKVAVAGSGEEERRVLSRADLSISFASENSVCFADATVLVPDRDRLPEIVSLARSGVRAGSRSLAVAIVYGIVAAAVSAGALVPLTGLAPSPVAAMGGAVAATVLTNMAALRLRKRSGSRP